MINLGLNNTTTSPCDLSPDLSLVQFALSSQSCQVCCISYCDDLEFKQIRYFVKALLLINRYFNVLYPHLLHLLLFFKSWLDSETSHSIINNELNQGITINYGLYKSQVGLSQGFISQLLSWAFFNFSESRYLNWGNNGTQLMGL